MATLLRGSPAVWVGAMINVKIIGDVKNRFARLIAQGELIQPHVAGAA
jgi:hypothetical protein